jgi:hydrophobe/amphiphile efflux-3 (HAE3) family protein
MSGDRSLLSRWLEHVGRFSARNPREVVLVTVVLLLVAGGVVFATVQLNMGMMLYIDDNSETAREWETLESSYERGNTVFVVVETGDVTDPSTVRLVDRLDDRYSDLDRISEVRSLADVVRVGANGRIPDSKLGIERAVARVERQNDATETLVGTVAPEPGTTVLVLSYGDVAPASDAGGPFDFVATKDSDVIEQRVTSRTDEITLPANASVTVTGASIFENAAFELMLIDVLKLFAGGFLFVFVIVYFTMRRRLETNWHAFFPLATALIALVFMLAAMGTLDYDFNAIMLSVLPVALGLGVDYGLQIQTRYAEEREAGRGIQDAAGIAAGTTGRTLLLAMGTTVVGFGSLFVSPIPPVRQFGVTAGISVLASMILSVTLLVALLVQFDDWEDRADSPVSADGRGTGNATGVLESAVTTVARVATARPLLVLLVLAPAVAGGALAYPQVDTTQQMLDYWPRDIQEREEFEQTTETVPSPKTIYVMIETDDAYEPSTFREVGAFRRRVTDLDHVTAVSGPVSTVRTATGGRVPASSDRIRAILRRSAANPVTGVTRPSRNPDQLLLTVRVSDVRGTEVRSLIERIDETAAAEISGADVAITGKPVLNRVIIENGTSGQVRMTALSFGVALLFLVVVLRSFKDSIVLIVSVPVTAAILMVGAMHLLDIPWNPGTVSMASIALGIGIDYGLHVYERYEELRTTTDLDAAASMEAALRKLSRPVFGSGITTMAGFGVVVFSAFPVVANFGKSLVLVIALSLLATFVTLPAVLLVDVRRPLGRRSDRPIIAIGAATTDAVSIPVVDDTDVETDGFRWEAHLGDFLKGSEDVLAVVAAADVEIRHEDNDGSTTVSPGTGCRAVVAATGERIRMVVGNTGREAAWTATVEHSSVASIETNQGVRRTELTITTREDGTYHVQLQGRHDLDSVVIAMRAADTTSQASDREPEAMVHTQ